MFIFDSHKKNIFSKTTIQKEIFNKTITLMQLYSEKQQNLPL